MSIPHQRHIDRQPYLNMLDRPERSASYLVFIDLAQEDGDIYKAVNGTTGIVQFRSSNFQIVLDYCRGQLTFGGSIHLKEGVYQLDSSFNMSVPNMVLQGEGKRTEILFNGPAQAINISANFVTVRNLRITLRAGAGNPGDRPNLIYGGSVNNILLSNLWLMGDTSVASDGSNILQNGVYFNNVTFSKITLCYIEDQRRNGISLQSCTNVIILGNTVLGNYQTGIYTNVCTDNMISSNTLQDNFAYGITLALNSDRNIISSNIIRDNRFSGILLSASSSNNVVGNNIFRNEQYGIYILSGHINTVVGNYVGYNAMDGIYLLLANTNIVASNEVGANVGYGIIVAGDSDNNKINGNYTGGNTVGSIQVTPGTCDNNQIEWNTVEEGAPVDAGTQTRSYGNYDPSADAFVGDVGAAPF